MKIISFKHRKDNQISTVSGPLETLLNHILVNQDLSPFTISVFSAMFAEMDIHKAIKALKKFETDDLYDFEVYTMKYFI